MNNMLTKTLVCGLAILCALLFAQASQAQTAQKSAENRKRTLQKLRVEYVGYRAARYETEALAEPDDERPNHGGLVYVYLHNVSTRPVQPAFYRINGKDASTWLLDGYLAWDRLYDRNIEPGEMTVLELNGFTEHFAEGQPFEFSYVDRTWRPACSHGTTLVEDAVQISLVRVLPGMDAVEVHVRYTAKHRTRLESLEVVGHAAKSVAWKGADIHGPGQAIARIQLTEPLKPSELVIVKLGVEEKGETRYVYSHRRAFEDWFPIGCWSNKEGTYALLRQHHIELVVRGGRADDAFYSDIAPKYGFRSMCPVEKFSGLDTIRSLENDPAVACWMLSDEPDWSTPAVVMQRSDEFVRRYNSTKPTFITLCRNVKFFEYAAIADIPCMDHYCVTAPTSSKWPHRYGTRLEETGYYTRDLKAASEPKPVWVWSQAIAGWDERPRRPVPTPDELAAQLLYNIGRGAKGIIWFNYDHEVAEKYPDARQAMQHWGRVLRMVRNDLLAADPLRGKIDPPDNVDVGALVSWDKMILCVNNQDYEIHPEAYPFRPQSGVEVSVPLPDWLELATALLLTPDGVEELPLDARRKKATVNVGTLDVCKLIVLANDTGAKERYEAEYAAALEDERREW